VSFKVNSQELSSIDSLTKRLEIAVEEDKINTLIQLSEAYRYEDFDLCVAYGKRAIGLAEEGDFDLLLAISMRSVAVSYYYNSKFNEALEYFERAYLNFALVHDSSGMAICLRNIGYVYQNQGKLTLSLEYCENSYDLYRKLQDLQGMGNSLIQIGHNYYYRNEFKKALDRYFNSLLIFRDIKEQEGIMLSEINIGIIYNLLGNHSVAIEYYTDALELSSKLNSKRSRSIILSNMAEIYNFKYENYELALKLHNEALYLKNELNDKYGEANQINNLGTVYGNMEQYKTAYEYFELSKEKFQNVGSISGITMAGYNMGKVYQSNGMHNSAIAQFKSSLKLAEEIGYVDYISSNQEALFESYVAMGDFENFEKYYQLYKAGQDTLIEKLNTAEMLEVEAKYKAEEATGKLNKINVEIDKIAHKLYIYKLLFFSLLGLMIIVLFSSLAYFYLKKKRN